MNNIRKIIEERLENAKLDYNRHNEIKEPIIKHYFKGQRHAYEDCLNLIPAPRTEQEIIKDFEKLGWKVATDYSKEYKLVLKREETKQLYGDLGTTWCHYIFIKENSYNAHTNGSWTTKGYDMSIQEHKLLSELFEVIF